MIDSQLHKKVLCQLLEMDLKIVSTRVSFKNPQKSHNNNQWYLRKNKKTTIVKIKNKFHVLKYKPTKD